MMRFTLGWMIGFACGGAIVVAVTLLAPPTPAPKPATMPVELPPTIMDRSELDASVLSRLRDVLRKQLHDPFSAQLMELRVGQNGHVCGALNAKNQMGGYTGFRAFVFDPSSNRIVHLPDLTNFDVTSADAGVNLSQAKKDIEYIGTSCRHLK